MRDLLLAAGISDEALEVNAYGKSQSVAADSDGYALERRVRLTLQAQEAGAAVAQVEREGVSRRAVVSGAARSVAAPGRTCFRARAEAYDRDE